jgi:hypothetical protein
MAVSMMQQRNEALYREDLLRARQFKIEQQLEHNEEYNDNLHEKVHRPHN